MVQRANRVNVLRTYYLVVNNCSAYAKNTHESNLNQVAVFKLYPLLAVMQSSAACLIDRIVNLYISIFY